MESSPFSFLRYILLLSLLSVSDGKEVQEDRESLLVVSTSGHRRTRVLNLNNPDFVCNLPDFPYDALESAGGLLEGNILLMCGGYMDMGRNSTLAEDLVKKKLAYQCYKKENTLLRLYQYQYHMDFSRQGNHIQHQHCLQLKNKAWTQATTLKRSVMSMERGGILINGSLLLHGGRHCSTILNLVPELVSINSSQELPSMVQRWYADGHCNMKINDTTILITGIGAPGGGVDSRTVFHNLLTGQLTEGPIMNVARIRHACASFEVNGRRIFLVAGGQTYKFIEHDRFFIEKSVEYLDVDQMELGWQMAPELPLYLFHPTTMVTSYRQDSVYLMGGIIVPPRTPAALAGAIRLDVWDSEVNQRVFEFKCKSPTPVPRFSGFEEAKLQDTRINCEWITLDTKLEDYNQDLTAVAISNEFADELCN